jgi:hypothetical protein
MQTSGFGTLAAALPGHRLNRNRLREAGFHSEEPANRSRGTPIELHSGKGHTHENCDSALHLSACVLFLSRVPASGWNLGGIGGTNLRNCRPDSSLRFIYHWGRCFRWPE